MANGNIMDVNFQMNESYLKAAVEDIVRAGIVKALGDPSEIVRKAIAGTINQKVDSEGRPTDRSYGATPYLTWLAERVVKDTVAECMKKYIEENKAVFEQEFMHQIRTKKFGNDLCAAYLKSIIESAQSTWKMPITVSFDPPKNDY